jgi:hypothetical protein
LRPVSREAKRGEMAGISSLPQNRVRGKNRCMTWPSDVSGTFFTSCT